MNEPDDSIKIKESDHVPLNAQTRVREIMKWSLSKKATVLPRLGQRFQMGPFTYEVTYVNESDLRFTLRLQDIDIQMKKPESRIIKP